MVPFIALAAALSLVAMLVFPVLGICTTLLVRPLIDATYATKIVGAYGLTELVGVGFPIAVLLYALLRARGPQRFTRMPLWPLWTLYGLDVLLFSLILMSNEGLEAGANILFRQINGIAGFYAGQTFFQGERSRLLLFRVLLAATLFPLAIGLYQFATGYQWTHADTEGITRYVGVYHDAFTVRYYMMQGILAAVMLLALRRRSSLVGRVLLLLFIACALVVMYRAYSKSAIATLVVWIVLWCVLRRKFVQLAVAAGLALLAIGIYAPVVSTELGQMFHKEVGAIEGHGDLNHTFAGRWYGWHQLLSQWNDLDGLSQSLGSHTAVGAHNDFLMILMHGGLIGLGIYLTLLACLGLRLLRDAFRRADPLALAGLMAFSLWCIDSIGLVPSSYPGYQWFIWSIVGVSLRARADERRAARVSQPTATCIPTTVRRPGHVAAATASD